jgi:hypothetical protein
MFNFLHTYIYIVEIEVFFVYIETHKNIFMRLNIYILLKLEYIFVYSET